MITRAIYSFYTDGGKSLPAAADHEHAMNAMMMEASVVAASEQFAEVVLYADKQGVEWLANNTACAGYLTAVNIIDFEAAADFDPRFWNFGKLVAYSLQTKPFIHLDFDVVIHGGFAAQLDGQADMYTERVRAYASCARFVARDTAGLPVPSGLICSGLLGGNPGKPWGELLDMAKATCGRQANEGRAVDFLDLVAVEEYNLSGIATRDGLNVKQLRLYEHFQGEKKFERFWHRIQQNGLAMERSRCLVRLLMMALM